MRLTDQQLIILAAAINAAAAIVLAILTGRYVRLTARMAEEMRTARDPSIYVDIELESGGDDFILVVGNAGPSPAINLAFAVEDHVPWREPGKHGLGLVRLPAVTAGIQYLAPGRRLKYLVGSFDWSKASPEAPDCTIKVSYQSEGRRDFHRIANIRLTDYHHLRINAFDPPEALIANAIEDVRRDQQHYEHAKDTARMLKQQCPVCAELISRQARKCPHCHEFLEADDSRDDSLAAG